MREGSPKASQYGVRVSAPAQNVRVVTPFDTPGAEFLSFPDFTQLARQTCTMRLAT
jgi:hypothetical protein